MTRKRTSISTMHYRLGLRYDAVLALSVVSVNRSFEKMVVSIGDRRQEFADPAEALRFAAAEVEALR